MGMRLIVALVLFGLAAPAFAEPWEGTYVLDGSEAVCGSVYEDDEATTYTAEAVFDREVSCEISGSWQLGNFDAWLLSTKCTDREFDLRATHSLIMRTETGWASYFRLSPDEPARLVNLHRCEAE